MYFLLFFHPEAPGFWLHVLTKCLSPHQPTCQYANVSLRGRTRVCRSVLSTYTLTQANKTKAAIPTTPQEYPQTLWTCCCGFCLKETSQSAALRSLSKRIWHLNLQHGGQIFGSLFVLALAWSSCHDQSWSSAHIRWKSCFTLLTGTGGVDLHYEACRDLN